MLFYAFIQFIYFWFEISVHGCIISNFEVIFVCSLFKLFILFCTFHSWQQRVSKQKQASVEQSAQAREGDDGRREKSATEPRESDAYDGDAVQHRDSGMLLTHACAMASVCVGVRVVALRVYYCLYSLYIVISKNHRFVRT